MQRKTLSIRELMILNIALLILLFLAIMVSDSLIQRGQLEKVEKLIENNRRIDEINASIEQFKLAFNSYHLSGINEDYLNFLYHSEHIENLLKELHPIFENHRDLILFSRIVSQINESQRELVSNYKQGNRNTPEAFEQTKQILAAFTILTDSWNTLINYYLQANHHSWVSTLEKSNHSKEIQMYLILSASCLILLFIVVFTNDLLKRLKSITEAAQALTLQKWQTADLSLSRYQEFKTVSQTFNTMKARIISDLQKLEESLHNEQILHEQTMQLKKQQLIMKQTQYDLLQAQINPHFLFNTLNMIIRTIQAEESDTAIMLIRATSELLRNSIELESKPIPLQMELNLLKQYLSIVEERNKGRIHFSVTIFGGDLQVLIPSFTLQSLVENAIKHGLSETINEGVVNIDVFSDEENGTYISISDNGKGESQLFFNTLYSHKKGHGLINIIDRLAMLYSNSDTIKIKSEKGRGCQIIIHVNRSYVNAEIINR